MIAGIPATVVRSAIVAAVLLTGCDSLAEGTATPAVTTASGTEATTESGSPTATTESASTTATESPTPSDGNDEEAALAAALGFAFAGAVDGGDLAAAYALLCQEDRDEVTLEEFSDGAPTPGTVTFVPGEAIGPGTYSGTLIFEDDDTEISLERDAAGTFCVTQPA